jgi:UDP-3-O-[3-hydroxymyristoyl] glucosamine N-acyltransferase
VEDGAVLGRTPRLASTSTATREDLGPTALEDGAVVCAGAIVSAGARIGERAIVGDQAHVRERTTIGRDSMLGPR